MATLTGDAHRDFQTGDYESHPMVAADIIYKHAAVGINSAGYARPLNASENDSFAGFAEAKVDNASGSAGDKRVRCKQAGHVVLTVENAVITSVGAAVYAYDDDTFTLQTGSPTGTLIGWVSRFVSAGVAVVEFDVNAVNAALHS